MPPPERRRGARPDIDDLTGLVQAPAPRGTLQKAPAQDPVLGITGGTVAPAPPAAPVRAAPLEEPSRPGSQTAGRRAPRKAAAPVAADVGLAKAKVGFYQDPEDTARARAAYNWTRAQEGHRSLSDFLAAAVMAEVKRLERKYNGGDPWPAMDPGELPTGKPMGA